MNNVKNMAIIGAGVAGLALAIFARKQGIKVTLYERGKHFSSIGAGVTLWPNANFVIQQLGLMDKVLKTGGRPSYMRQFNRQGEQQNEFDISVLNAVCGFPTINLFRRDLIQLLADALQPLNATVIFNQALTSQDIPRLQQQFDLVVGADGRMHSPARQYLYGNTIQPTYQGFINIIGLCAMEYDQSIHEYRDNGERFGIVPVTQKEGYWAAAWPCDMDESKTLKSWFDEMHQRFQHWPDKVQHVLENYDPNSVKRLFVHDLDPLPHWHRDNLVIIGDAAHAPLPTSGQGASQALEDAWHLSLLLKQHQPLDSLLSQFYNTRIHKASSAQLIGRQVAHQIFQQPSPTTQTVQRISTEQLSKLYMEGLGSNH
ncbi:NAD(P)/FAD-dependent oxidoreductase [Marinomonas sp. FW-1]|uniref:FAD-dependent oxidoreductase n=1 Tax=Marinomonas sp. FW-1 TaxID=2071621 RepID=UPI0010BFD103|nr:FAD-dependent oxidoreductase [Marinomonas sp. FW-1]